MSAISSLRRKIPIINILEINKLMKETKSQMVSIAILALLFSLFLIAYLLVWLSGEFDNSQYIDTYRVFVTGGLVLSYVALKKLED